MGYEMLNKMDVRGVVAVFKQLGAKHEESPFFFPSRAFLTGAFVPKFVWKTSPNFPTNNTSKTKNAKRKCQMVTRLISSLNMVFLKFWQDVCQVDTKFMASSNNVCFMFWARWSFAWTELRPCLEDVWAEFKPSLDVVRMMCHLFSEEFRVCFGPGLHMCWSKLKYACWLWFLHFLFGHHTYVDDMLKTFRLCLVEHGLLRTTPYAIGKKTWTCTQRLNSFKTSWSVLTCFPNDKRRHMFP